MNQFRLVRIYRLAYDLGDADPEDWDLYIKYNDSISTFVEYNRDLDCEWRTRKPGVRGWKPCTAVESALLSEWRDLAIQKNHHNKQWDIYRELCMVLLPEIAELVVRLLPEFRIGEALLSIDI